MKKISILFAGILLSVSGFSQSWLLTGNAGTSPGTNFLGTTDAQRLVFKTNNTEHMTILANGNVGIGTTTPAMALQITSNSIDQFLRLNGNSPSLQLIDSPGITNRLGKLGFASSSNIFVSGSVAGDMILQNLDSAGSLIFGTNATPSNGIERMRITAAGYVGLATASPAARFDVDCSPLSGKTNPSNIRFRNLESGSGSILVIDSNGYVYRAASGASAATPATPLTTDMQSQIEDLKNQVQELRSLLASKVALSPSEAKSLQNESATWLGDNYPNPASGTTTISYSLPSQVGAALCQVYSLDGKQVATVALGASAGRGQVQFATGKLPSGIYIYSLVVDGKLVDTKKMVISN
jgi:hypothetical protein